ncbi:MAG: phosphodiester glycosidase family protein [Clostridia bacterium]
MKDNKSGALLRGFGRALSLLLATLLSLVLILLGLVWVFEKGPSPTLTAAFCSSVRETSAIRWLSRIFLSEEELSAYLQESTSELDTEPVNTSLIHVAAREAETPEPGEELELIDISYGNCRGKLLIVSDPKRVVLGYAGNFVSGRGLQLTEMVELCGGIAGVNAGGFVDNNGLSNGGLPTGLVICEGEIAYGSEQARYSVIGLDQDGVLIVGTMTGAEALEAGVIWGVSFVTHDGIASTLIINGEVQTQNLGRGVNPRTAIGQREDGALLLLVLDGRGVRTLGATLENVVDILQQYGAVNAANLDGGSSSVMVYDGEIVNVCASVTGPRSIPTGFIVLGEGD